jgi:hypothetical protein
MWATPCTPTPHLEDVEFVIICRPDTGSYASIRVVQARSSQIELVELVRCSIRTNCQTVPRGAGRGKCISVNSPPLSFEPIKVS